MMLAVGPGWDAEDVLVEVEEWAEVRITGQPNGPYPRYDVTFQSNHDNWSSLDRITELAKELWSDVTIRSRLVRREVRSTAWEEQR